MLRPAVCIFLVIASVLGGLIGGPDDNTATTHSTDRDDALPVSHEHFSSATSDESFVIGTLKCNECHVQPTFEYKNSPDLSGFVGLNEFTFWLIDDAHAKAYLRIIPDENHYRSTLDNFNALVSDVRERNRAPDGTLPQFVNEQWGASNIRSRQILEQMGIENLDTLFSLVSDRQKLRKAAFSDNDMRDLKPQLESVQMCLGCHASWRKSDPLPEPNVFGAGIGVGCESCHGPASKWRDEHAKPAWRTMDPHVKSSQEYGMVNVRDPKVRAEQCLSCHVGNVAEGKVLTHKMFAAGHPPLPGIEVEAYSTQMPRHWRYLSEKGNFAGRSKEVELEPGKIIERDEYFEKYYRFDGNQGEKGEYVPWSNTELPMFKSVVVGGVKAANVSLALVAALASESNSDNWPEFAAFDCAACHHDLRSESWRKNRPLTGRPGRPRLNYWPEVLLKLGVNHLKYKGIDKGNELSVFEAKLQEALDAQPFGTASALADKDNGVARKYAVWLDDLAADLSAVTYQRKDALNALSFLCRPDAHPWDFHSARQAIWAIQSIHGELKSSSNRHVASDGSNANSAAGTAPTDSSDFDLPLKVLSDMLLLDLPKHAGDITSQQSKILELMRVFNADDFVAELKKLDVAVSAEIDQMKLQTPPGR